MFTNLSTSQMLIAQVILCASAAIVIKTTLASLAVINDNHQVKNSPTDLPFNTTTKNPQHSYWFKKYSLGAKYIKM